MLMQKSKRCAVLKRINGVLSNKEGLFVDTGILIIIAVVLGSLTLGGLYTITKDTVFPKTEAKMQTMLSYAGEPATATETVTKIKGDFNGDGVLDDADKEILVDEILKISGDYEMSELDLNEDGALNMKDLLRFNKLVEASGGQ